MNRRRALTACPFRFIAYRYAVLAAAILLLLDWGCTAHAGQLSTVDNSRPSLKRLRRETRIVVLRPARVSGRAAAGYPLLQTAANTTRAVANVTGLLNPLGWILR